MDKSATKQICQVIQDLLTVGIFPGELAPAVVQAHGYVSRVIKTLENESAPTPAIPASEKPRKKKVAK